jgi:hypothetical protein
VRRSDNATTEPWPFLDMTLEVIVILVSGRRPCSCGEWQYLIDRAKANSARERSRAARGHPMKARRHHQHQRAAQG